MNWLESIKAIRNAQERNQLVVFVGAGVSKNSGLPSWGELVKSIAEKIGYYHQDPCNECESRNAKCPLGECKRLYDFSQDEFLRIPEYFFQSDLSNDHIEYYHHIVETLNVDGVPNAIDEEIFNLLPHHIITTNYDSLLEDSSNISRKLYTVVSEDRDLLSHASEHYIIKMHGDLDIPHTMVLKESDYINYEQDHPLISTFIRSLLVNHTFLFLGYSLNDYNLNLIIGWINYFQKKYKVAERPKSFLIDSRLPTEHEQLRLEAKNIYIVNTSEVPSEIQQKAHVPESLSSDIGKKLYTYLRSITDFEVLDTYLPLEAILADKYSLLESYNKISFDDLIRVHPLGRTKFYSTQMCFYDMEWYQKVEKALHSGNKVVISTFQRAGITSIYYFNDDSECEIPLLNAPKSAFFPHYINNDYISLQKEMTQKNYPAEKIYYLHLLGATQAEIDSSINQSNHDLSTSDYVCVLLCKMRNRLAKLSLFDRQEKTTKEIRYLFRTAPEPYRNAIGYLQSLFNSSAEQMLKMQEILEKQEKRNEYGKLGWESGHAFTYIWELQAYAYNYYYFFKDNFLPFDYFTEVKQYFSYYVQAFLCSYIPEAPTNDLDDFFIRTDHRNYSLNEIDLDILVKYTESKSLSNWIKKYHVQTIELDKDVKFVPKYINLCHSFVEICKQEWTDQILNFTMLLCLIELDNETKKEIFSEFVASFEQASKKSANLCESLFDSLFYLCNHLTVDNCCEIQSHLLEVLLKDDVFTRLSDRHHHRLMKLVKDYASLISDDLQKKQVAIIELQ